jgi:GntR family transcriptional regulator
MPQIDPSSGRPVFRQIADHLRQAIREGNYAPGQPLPSESELTATYGVTGVTVRRGIEVLKTEGLVRSERGRGVFVREQPTIRRLARNRQSRALRETGHGAYDVEMKHLGTTPTVTLDELGEVQPPIGIAVRLHLAEDATVLIRRRRYYADDQPTQLATSWVPWELAEGTQMTEPDTGPGGLYSRLAEGGHGPVRFVEDVATRMSGPEENRFFQFAGPQPVLYLVRTAFDASDRPVEVCETIMSGDRWQLSYEWQAD